MLSLRDIALTIEERTEGQFYWVVLEACEGEMLDVPVYRRIEAAARPQPSYHHALELGNSVVRRLVD